MSCLPTLLIRKFLLCIIGAFLLVFPASAFAQEGEAAGDAFIMDESKFHITADRTLYHSNVKVHEAFGHVVMTSGDRRLSSDYAWIDQKTGDVRVRGNVVFVATNWTIQAAEMHFNMRTGTGSIFYGAVSNDNYRLRGQLIRKIGENRFLTSDGEYTTCRDCAESWKMAARTVDLTIDGYAYLEDVYVVIKDVPTMYLPYMIVPVKTRRQTGFLFPRVGSGSRKGFSFVQPFFLAIDDHQDATLAYGRYSKRGKRGEFQYRYQSYTGIKGVIDGFYLEDRDFKSAVDRYALKTEHEWAFTRFFDMRWRINDSKDREYPIAFPEDVAGLNLPAMESNVNMTTRFDNFFITAEAKRYRSLLNANMVGFDKDMVQTGPSIYFGLSERRYFGLFDFNLYGTFDRFYRDGGSFQDLNLNGFYDPFTTDRIREAQRLQVAPELSRSFKLGRALTLQPTLQYNERLYLFDVRPATLTVPTLHSRYLLGRVQLSSTFERVFSMPESSIVEKLKHQITPILTYSNVPWSEESKSHPFIQQISQPGGSFDQFDIIQAGNRPDFLREPIGNSVSLGIFSRLIRKRRVEEVNFVYPYTFLTPKQIEYPDPENRKQEEFMARSRLFDQYQPRYANYRQVWLVTLNQALDLKEVRRKPLVGERPQAPFSPLLLRSVVSLENFSKYLEYQYKPYGKYLDRENAYRRQHDLRVFGEWTLKSLTNPRGTLFFKRSLNSSFTMVTSPNPARVLGLGFTWSFNDYLSVSYLRDFDLINRRRKLREMVSTTYNSPSECWQLRLRYEQRREVGTDFGVDLALNLMGSGYLGLGGGNAQGGLN